MPAIGNLSAASQAEVDAVDTVAPIETGSAGSTIKGTILQWILSMLRPSKLTEAVTGDTTDSAKFLIEDAAYSGRTNRWISLANLKTLIFGTLGVYKLQQQAIIQTANGWELPGPSSLAQAGIAYLRQSKSSKEFVIPISGVRLGATLTKITVNGGITSAGNTATLSITLYAMVNVGQAVPLVLVTGTTLVVADTANLKLDVANASLTYSTDFSADYTYFLLIQGDTGAGCEIGIQSIDITVT